jgi:hypothetical protein
LTDSDREKLENLEALTRFAERTVIEAAKQANSIVTQAQEQAAAESERIAAEYKSTAWRQSEETVNSAQPKAQELQRGADPQGQANDALSRLVRNESAFNSSNIANSKAEEILQEARNKIEEGAQIVKDELEKLQTKSQKISTDQVKQVLETIDQQFLSLIDVLGNQPDTNDTEPQSDLQAAIVETLSSDDQLSESLDETPNQFSSLDLPEADSAGSEFFDGTVELALPPPVALDRMLQLHKHLKETPHVDVLNLGGSVDKGITIRILLDGPTPLLQTIGELEEVWEVEEELPGTGKRVPSSNGIEDYSIRRVIVSTRE